MDLNIHLEEDTPPEEGLESGGKDNTKQMNELLLRALQCALPVL